MFREEKLAESTLGIEADRLTSGGRLVPDEMVNAVIRGWLESQEGDGFVFDGYPRSLGQAEAMEEAKNPDNDNVFALYKLVADNQQIKTMRTNYLGGNYGYGRAKQELFDLLITKFAKEREAFNFYMSNLDELENKLKKGEERAKRIAREVLNKVRVKLGFS